MYIKIKNLINHFVFITIDFLLSGKHITNPNSLLLIRLDAIGDYVLFRNFIQVINESSRFKGYDITLCGNILWKDLAETLDSDKIKNFIWMDRKKYSGNYFYKYQFLKTIRNRGFEIAIETEYSREILFGDEIIKASRAKQRIGNKGAIDKHSKWKKNLFSDKWYTKLFSSSESPMFEFYRNKEFFENLLDNKIEITAPFINVDEIACSFIPAKPYAVIFHGAAREEKIWNQKKYSEVALHLIKSYSLNIVLAGGKNEIENSFKIASSLPKEKVFDLTGKTSLPELAKIIKSAELLISNDSAAVHIASAVRKKLICISNGERFGRFLPYPNEIFDKGYYVYPAMIKNNSKTFDENSKLYMFESKLDINSISSQEVIKLCDEIMTD